MSIDGCRLEFRETPRLDQIRIIFTWLRNNGLDQTTRREYKDGWLHAFVFEKKSDAMLFKMTWGG